jgi:DNA-binding PadR family transcriptional regulator
MKGTSLGAFEELVLLAVRALGSEAYGAQLQRILEREAGRPISLGAVHTALERLESKGLIDSEASSPTAERGGRSRRIFTATAQGRAALRHVEALRQRLDRLSKASGS